VFEGVAVEPAGIVVEVLVAEIVVGELDEIVVGVPVEIVAVEFVAALRIAVADLAVADLAGIAVAEADGPVEIAVALGIVTDRLLEELLAGHVLAGKNSK
jgi:hypothetical protein